MSLRLPATHPLFADMLTPAEIVAMTRGNKRLRGPDEPTAEDKIAETLRVLELSIGMVRQFQFHPTRKWAADFAWPKHMLLVEYDGLILNNEGGRCVVRGGHATVTGIRNDHEKLNAAQMCGYTMLRYEAQAVREGRIYNDIDAVLRARGYFA